MEKNQTYEEQYLAPPKYGIVLERQHPETMLKVMREFGLLESSFNADSTTLFGKLLCCEGESPLNAVSTQARRVSFNFSGFVVDSRDDTLARWEHFGRERDVKLLQAMAGYYQRARSPRAMHAFPLSLKILTLRRNDDPSCSGYGSIEVVEHESCVIPEIEVWDFEITASSTTLIVDIIASARPLV